MKCVDAIEGNVKSILRQLHKVFIENRLDDSEYIRNAKAVIDATDQFIEKNRELVENPDMLKRILYEYSRYLWLVDGVIDDIPNADIDAPIMEPENEEYQTYYYDYLYHCDLYPR